MNRYTIVANGVVTNVILWDGVAAWTPPGGSTMHLIPDDSPVSSGWSFDGANYTAPVITPPVLTSAQQIALAVQNAIGAGLTVNSTSTPAINGLYAIDQPAQLNIAAVTNYILVNNDFPGGVATYPWADLNGNFHVFPTVALFEHWATAIANYVAQLKLYAAGAAGVTLPSPTVTIA